MLSKDESVAKDEEVEEDEDVDAFLDGKIKPKKDNKKN